MRLSVTIFNFAGVFIRDKNLLYSTGGFKRYT